MPFRKIHFDLPRWAIVVLIWSPFLMGSIGTYSVIRGTERSDNNCEAVKGLRDDLVQVVKDGDSRSTKTITEAFDGPQRIKLILNLKAQTRATLAKIQDPQCP
jgi:hypothetical protein